MRQEPISKGFIGALVFGALLSVLFIKVFSDLALAGEPTPEVNPFGNGVEILGTFQIVEIEHIYKDQKSSLCSGSSRNSNCGQKLVALRSGSEIALLKGEHPESADENDGWTQSFLLLGAFGANGCKSAIPTEKAKSGIFSSKLCRAHLSGASGAEFKFPAAEITDPATQAGVTAAATTAALGIPIGSGSSFELKLEGDINSPSQIMIEESISGVVFFPVHSANRFRLDRVEQ